MCYILKMEGTLKRVLVVTKKTRQRYKNYLLYFPHSTFFVECPKSGVDTSFLV